MNERDDHSRSVKLPLLFYPEHRDHYKKANSDDKVETTSEDVDINL